MKSDKSLYIGLLGKLLQAHANPKDAAFMKKYMRNQFEYFGIRAPLRKGLFKKFIKENGMPDSDQIEMTCIELYKFPEREYHYFALELAERNIIKFNESAVKLFEYMIVTKSWWDTVDFIAASTLGRFFRYHPSLIPEVTTNWIDSGNIWLQRSCILFQLKYKLKTDISLLYGFIEKLNSSDEFFIQKAIGWFLREYSKVNPEEVYIYTQRTVLKPLSKREALRIMKKNGLIAD